MHFGFCALASRLCLVLHFGSVHCTKYVAADGWFLDVLRQLSSRDQCSLTYRNVLEVLMIYSETAYHLFFINPRASFHSEIDASSCV